MVDVASLAVREVSVYIQFPLSLPARQRILCSFWVGLESRPLAVACGGLSRFWADQGAGEGRWGARGGTCTVRLGAGIYHTVCSLGRLHVCPSPSGVLYFVGPAGTKPTPLSRAASLRGKELMKWHGKPAACAASSADGVELHYQGRRKPDSQASSIW